MANHKASPVLHGNLDFPAPNDKVYDQTISFSGWVYAADRDPKSSSGQSFF